ncbi:unnamed protein product [Candidula unifasciata]|uniref:Proline-rich protein PRCC n=1 Tax=Candidula unifasciata TaxID=100452 RepID=A0A8S4A908_9EUPU|nr:unnamed protein product [Candidula unifasciata]
MSLVSYGASDGSDTSDDDTVTTNVQTTHKVETKNVLSSGHISDDEDFDASVGSSSVTSTWTSDVQSVKGFDNGLLRNLKPDDAVNSTSVTTLEDLPAPQSRIYATVTEETDLEDEVKPKASEIANAPKPPSKKLKQPVKITIPSLDEEPDNEDKELKKKTDSSKVKSGLFSLLPAPVHTSKKETNRPLIPYTLTKKPSSSTSSTISSTGGKQSTSTQLKSSTSTKVKSNTEAASTTEIFSKRMSTFNALTGYDSDSEDDDDAQGSTTNFFSLSSTSEVIAGSTQSDIAKKRLQSEEVSSSKSDITLTVVNQSKQEEDVASSEKKEKVENVVEEKVSGPEPGAVNDAPLDFRSVNRLSAWSGSSYGFLGPVGLSGPVQEHKSYSLSVSSSSLPSSSDYNMANSEVSSEMDDEGIETLADDDLKKFMGEKEFQKLQGKRKRFEEAVDFVDANVDDFVDPSEVTKHLTEETEYVSQRNKDNLPTAQQRRKKQITYLAYQAKERELELKNTWAQNRMTKKQTQSKYGF